MKIGITTHYYNSTNYGGTLQAYALCRKLNEYFDAEQICIDAKDRSAFRAISNGNIITNALKAFKRARRFLRKKIFSGKYSLAKKQLESRKAAILRFGREMIPHSEEIYRPSDMARANEKYDAFVTGSDQVWHPSAWNEAYRLDFANQDKTKISYAASIAKSSLKAKELRILEESLKTYKAVSVREKNAVDIVSPVSPVSVSCVLDPVFLLSKEEWSEISSERLFEEPYVFCYFLGSSNSERRAAEKYAAEHGFKLVTLPYLTGEYRKCDEKYGDERIFEASPSDFLSLVENAEVVFTDSFHAVAFSIIYEKEFFVFPRSSSDAMSSRIISILSIIDSQDRFIKSKKCEENINNISKMDYPSKFGKMSLMKEFSSKFLLNNLM